MITAKQAENQLALRLTQIFFFQKKFLLFKTSSEIPFTFAVGRTHRNITMRLNSEFNTRGKTNFSSIACRIVFPFNLLVTKYISKFQSNVVAEWIGPSDSTFGDHGFKSRIEVNAR